MCAFGPAAAVVTLGADGLVVVDGVGVSQIPAFSVTAVTSHGAGDVFCGALAAEMTRGAGLHEAARFGAVAALTVATRPDARDAIMREAVREKLENERAG